jgi:hypothetical protein
MAELVLLDPAGKDGATVLVRRVRMADRVAARLHANALDRRLAAGASPDSSVRLMLHAQRLLRRRDHRRMARCIRLIVRTAEHPPLVRAGPVLVREQVLEAAAELERLAERLDAGPVEVRGIAITRLLLTEGTGLYHPRGQASVASAVKRALDALTPPHSVGRGVA